MVDFWDFDEECKCLISGDGGGGMDIKLDSGMNQDAF